MATRFKLENPLGNLILQQMEQNMILNSQIIISDKHNNNYTDIHTCINCYYYYYEYNKFSISGTLAEWV